MGGSKPGWIIFVHFLVWRSWKFTNFFQEYNLDTPHTMRFFRHSQQNSSPWRHTSNLTTAPSPLYHQHPPPIGTATKMVSLTVDCWSPPFWASHRFRTNQSQHRQPTVGCMLPLVRRRGKEKGGVIERLVLLRGFEQINVRVYIGASGCQL